MIVIVTKRKVLGSEFTLKNVEFLFFMYFIVDKRIFLLSARLGNGWVSI